MHVVQLDRRSLSLDFDELDFDVVGPERERDVRRGARGGDVVGDTVAATESLVIILKPLALILATTDFNSGTEKPIWFTVLPIVPPVGACIGRKNKNTFGNSMTSRLLSPIVASVPPSVST